MTELHIFLSAHSGSEWWYFWSYQHLGAERNLSYFERNPADKSSWWFVTLHPAQIAPSDNFPISPCRNLDRQGFAFCGASLPNPPRVKLSRKNASVSQARWSVFLVKPRHDGRLPPLRGVQSSAADYSLARSAQERHLWLQAIAQAWEDLLL